MWKAHRANRKAVTLRMLNLQHAELRDHLNVWTIYC